MLSKVQIVELMQTVGHDRYEPEKAALYSRHMSPDLCVLEPAGLPYGGAFRGEKELAELDRIYNEIWSHSTNRRLRYIENGDFVICYLEGHYTSRATGRTASTKITEWWRLDGEMIVEIDIFYQDVAKLLEAIRP